MAVKRILRGGTAAAAALCFLSTGTLVASVVCCKYTYTWPSDWNPSPDGPCAGPISTSCESGAPAASPGDPRARLTVGTRQARCYVVVLSGWSHFIRADCSQPPPPPAYLLGVLPDGQCCFVASETGSPPQPEPYYQEFWVSNCVNACEGSEDPE
jgi:hypothetical protein